MPLVSDDAANIQKIREALDMLCDGLNQLSFRRGDSNLIKMANLMEQQSSHIKEYIRRGATSEGVSSLILPTGRH